MDLRLLRIHDVHDDAAFLHAGEAALHQFRAVSQRMQVEFEWHIMLLVDRAGFEPAASALRRRRSSGLIYRPTPAAAFPAGNKVSLVAKIGRAHV